ncbi:MAG TPA: S-methyl-5'-thioinosine phosphorylase [Chthonomonadales bacterium]|nr:S-methyl-5'-thioinosine phosphorylase [Chthonomonadales bacterium]
MSTVAIIGGSGLERLPTEYSIEPLVVETRFGRAVAARARRGELEVIFLSRHGETHGLAPHKINYRANIAALVELGVERVLATNAVGSLRIDLPPDSLILLSDFLDFTRGRPLTFWEGVEHAPSPVVHTDFTEPYCPQLRETLMDVATRLDVKLLPRGVYLCTAGPRYETPAEVRLFAQWGADVVGMTGVPEAVFAREAGLCYAAVGIVTNYAAGLQKATVTHEEVMSHMATCANVVLELLMAAAGSISVERTCRCAG